MRGHQHLCYASTVLLTAVLLGGCGMIPVIAQQTTAAALRPVTATAQVIGYDLQVMSNIARSVTAQTAVTGREITMAARTMPPATPAVYSPRVAPVPRAAKKIKSDPGKKDKNESEKAIQDWGILPPATLKRLTTDQVALQRAAQKEAATAIVGELIFWKLEGRQGTAKAESENKMGAFTCRTFEQTLTFEDSVERATATACRTETTGWTRSF